MPIRQSVIRIGAWIAALLLVAGLAWAGDRAPLAKEGLHDPANPSLSLLQQPSAMVLGLPGDTAGSGVNWHEALEEEAINPRTGIQPGGRMKLLDLDLVMSKSSPAPFVRFPHKQHTEWFDCKDCHESLFKSKAGTTPHLNMFAILQGESCGVCHGAVAFPLTECGRCHSVQPR